MIRAIRKRTVKTGLPPGTLIHIGERKTDKVKVKIFDYDESQFTEKEAATIEECFPFRDKPTVTWINIDGLHDISILERLGSRFGLHPLLLEDILNTYQRPKMEDYDDYIYFVLKIISCKDNESDIEAEQISIILGSNFVISFQEREGDVFNPIRDRIRNNKGRIRKSGPDYLAYALIDAIVDNYFIVMENFDQKIENADQQLSTNPTPDTLNLIRELKSKMIVLKNSIWPLRELITSFVRSDSVLIHDSTDAYLKDVYDHTIHIIDTVDSYRDMLAGMLDIYLSTMSNKMNEVMKVLTIFAAIFIPLTFIAGIYGMNFKFMPELDWHWGYFSALGFMLLATISLLIYFRRKKWL